MGIRISGMASGMDTEKIVKDLMKAQREPVNRLQRQKQLDEWKRESYREMNTLLADLQNTIKTLRLSSSFSKKIATSENDLISSAKVVGNPGLSSYSLEVLNLAVPGTNPQAAFSPTETSSTNPIGGADFTLTLKKDKDGNGTIDASEQFNISLSGTNDTMDSVVSKINSSNAGVKASFFNGKLVLQSEDGTKFDYAASAANSLQIPTTQTASSAAVPGTDAQFKINGQLYTSRTNTFTFDGMELTLKQANAGKPVTINTKPDEESIFTMVKDFVTKYNEVIEKINEKISEQKYKGYQPLLDEEKEELPEKTAEKLEAMARSGSLLRDPILKSGLDEMRRAISSPLKVAGVNAAFDTLTEIGIGGAPNGKYAYQENGKLYIDETKLRTAIRNNGNDVLKLFTNYSSENTDLQKKYNESGIAERLYDQLNKVMDKVTKQAGSSGSIFDDSFLSKKIKQTDDAIEQWEDRLKVIEDRYWKQFTAMESAMSKAQSQGSWFSQMLGQ